MRLIDADEMRENLLWCKSQSSRYDNYWDDVIERLDAQPTIDATPVKHGKWFDAMVGELPVQVCDQCCTFFPLAYTGGGHHYCPNCGAKMDLEEEPNGTDNP